MFNRRKAAAIAAAALAITPAVALAQNAPQTAVFASHVRISSGDSYYGGSRFVIGVSGASEGTAYSGVYVTSSFDSSRISPVKYCESPGCYVDISFGKSGSNYLGYSGRATIHHHGNVASSIFDASHSWIP